MVKARCLLFLALLSPSGLVALDESETLTILGIAEWNGRFAADSSGRGGLAALRAFYDSLDHKKDRGTTLLFHTGAFTGAASAAQFRQALAQPAPDLTLYMRFGALGLPAKERILLSESGLKIPSPLFAPGKDLPAGRVQNLLLAGGLVYTTSLEAAPAQAARSLSDLLLDVQEKDAPLGVVLLPMESASAFLGAVHIPDVHSARPPEGSLLFIEPGKTNRFYRDPAGPLVCSIQGRSVCVVELRMRGRRIIASSQRFVDLNGRDNPASFIKPDPVLTDLFPGR